MIRNTVNTILIACVAFLLAVSCEPSANNSNDLNNSKESRKEVKVAKIDTVKISGMEYHPADLTVNKGDTVVWINEDIVPHNVTAFPGNEWTSGTLNVGTTWKKVMEDDIDYYCSIHPTMKGKIAVKDGKVDSK